MKSGRAIDASRVKFAVISSRRDQSVVRRVPAPQAVIGQFGTAPPAMDRVVPAEIFSTGQNCFTERGQLQLALFISLETMAVIVQVQRERPLVEAGHGGRWTTRQPVEQGADFPIARTHAAGCASSWPGKTSNGRASPADISSSIRISVAPRPRHIAGSSSSRPCTACRSCGRTFKSLDSRSNQACGVGAR